MQGVGGSVFWLIILLVFMYFMLVRPQQKHRKIREEMLANLKVGDKIVTVGGFYGKIIKLYDDTMTLEIADNLCVKMQREAVNFVIEEEEEKEDE
ncbi:MAG: preprotein translocase subunit YajC [Clostridia bacterium]|nr:preprotein translocase subunit YajC [Clostridia bacterium]